MIINKTISPIDNSVYVERIQINEADLMDTVEKARDAQKAWVLTSIDHRAQICHRAIDAFEEKQPAHVEELAWQMGRPVRYGAGEVAGFSERARYMIDIAADALNPVEINEKKGFTRYIKREPLGIILTIAPWNFPYLTAVNSVVPSLMAGNSVLLKHSSQTPLCSERMVEAFKQAGLPDGVFQYLHMDHDLTAKLIGSNQINYVAFTGSVGAGENIEQAAVGKFIGVGLELGGKDPAYVRMDANLQHAIEGLVDGAFFNSGQSCCAVERIYVHKSVYDDFIEGFIALTCEYQLGNPLNEKTTLGPLVKASSAEFVRSQINEAVKQGASTLIDPGLFSANMPGSPYLAPQALVNVDHSMRIMTQESFGPVVGIMKVESDKQAIELMNDSEFGLSASVWTMDMEAAQIIGDRVNTGTWFMNRCDYLDPALAWTGVKNSGRGCTLSSIGYHSLTRPKSYHLRVFF